jgi:hypothetical protein
VRLVRQRAVIEAHRHGHGDEAEHDPVDLRVEDVARTNTLLIRGAVDLRQPDQAECDDGADHRQVDVKIEASFEHLSAFNSKFQTPNSQRLLDGRLGIFGV